jgi:hypothetical protein
MWANQNAIQVPPLSPMEFRFAPKFREDAHEASIKTPSLVTVHMFPLPPPPARGTDGKISDQSKQLGEEVFGGLTLFYSYQDVHVRSLFVLEPQTPNSTAALQKRLQLSVTVCNRKLSNLSAHGTTVSMAFFFTAARQYAMHQVDWCKCPSLNASTKIFQYTLPDSTPHDMIELQLFIKSPNPLPGSLPALQTLELSFIGKTIKGISPHDTTFLLYKRLSVTSNDTDSIGILRGSRSSLSKLAPYFKNCKQCSKNADLAANLECAR